MSLIFVGPIFKTEGELFLSRAMNANPAATCDIIPVDTVINLVDQDIALIKLSIDIKENDYVSPVCLQFGQQGNSTEFDSFEKVGWSEKKLRYSTIIEELENTQVVIRVHY